MEKAQKAVGKEEFWTCDRDTCKYRVLLKDRTGKAFKASPRRCPSCGKLPDAPHEKIAATRDPR